LIRAWTNVRKREGTVSVYACDLGAAPIEESSLRYSYVLTRWPDDTAAYGHPSRNLYEHEPRSKKTENQQEFLHNILRIVVSQQTLQTVRREVSCRKATFAKNRDQRHAAAILAFATSIELTELEIMEGSL